MCFDDGASPPSDIIDKWRALIRSTFDGVKSSTEELSRPCIAIHCVAGLGRAPVLVAIALIENGMDAVQAVKFIREKRRGAINAVQLNYLIDYKPARESSGGSCSIM